LLKWPNDILLAGEKLAGVLLENVGSTVENRSIVVIGTGINLASHPEDLQPAVSSRLRIDGNAGRRSKCSPPRRMNG
jgi:biotin-(acetyl-CoA carboxylase) ligase